MSDNSADSASDEVDVFKMKVVLLKKKLKALGLPTTGKKAELVTRLQAALMTKKDFSCEDEETTEKAEEGLQEQTEEVCMQEMDFLECPKEMLPEDESKEKSDDEFQVSESEDEKMILEQAEGEATVYHQEENVDYQELQAENPIEVKDYAFEDPTSEGDILENLNKREERYRGETLDESFLSEYLESNLKEDSDDDELVGVGDVGPPIERGEAESQEIVSFEREDSKKIKEINASENLNESLNSQYMRFDIKDDQEILCGISESQDFEKKEVYRPTKKFKTSYLPTPKDEEEVNVLQHVDRAEKNIVPGEPKESRKLVKLVDPHKGLSDSDIQKQRAQKFNVSRNSEEKVSECQLKTKNIASAGQHLELLRKRALRFGETSSTLLKLEDEEKRKQRKIRFSEWNKVDDDEEKKKARK